ncbi:MAG: CAAX prenyl protease-related protein [Verrucomicrobiia bacterium]
MADTLKSKPWLPYVVPMGIYMAFLLAQSDANLLWMYPVKTLAVAAALVFFRKQYVELRSPMICGTAPTPGPSAGGELKEGGAAPTTAGGPPALQSWVWAALIGLVAIVIWIGIDSFYPKMGKAVAPFDPTTIQSVAQRNFFLAFRVFGAVIVVPVMEELFWRAFLIRWLVNEDFKSVAVGTFTWMSFAVTVALFGGEHYQWLAGLICGAMYNWLYYRRKDVFACVVAHAVSNAALAAWVLARGDWKFW